MKNLYSFLLISIFSAVIPVIAQKYVTFNGMISIYSYTPFEDIQAQNDKVIAVLDASTGEVGVSCIMKSFRFKNTLMEEHFNENYVESHIYPKATFKGKLINTQILKNYNVENTAQVEGIMFIHGIEKIFRTPVKIISQENEIRVRAEFEIDPTEYNIKIPQLVRNKIAEKIKVNVDMKLKKQE